MKPIDRELLRQEILRLAANSLPQAVSLRILSVYLGPVFHSVDRETIHAEVLYLEGKSFLHSEAKAISPENKLWTITSEGRDFLASQGLE